MITLTRYQSKVGVRFIKFCIVGGTGFLIQLGVSRLAFYLFTSHSVEPSTANTLSVIVAVIPSMISNFTFNSIWTFRK